MSRRQIDKAALLLSPNTPCYIAASSAIGEVPAPKERKKRKLSGEDALYHVLYGVTKNAVSGWMNGTHIQQKRREELAKQFNKARRDYPAIGAVTDELDADDFTEGVECFSFAAKFGYERVLPESQRSLMPDHEGYLSWYEAQRHMNEVQFANGQLGREHSIPFDSIARDLTARFIHPPRYTGACLMYFKSLSANRNEPVFVRATLRIQLEVGVKGSLHYIPCKVKMYVPSISDVVKKPKTYIGYVSLRSENLYFSLADERKSTDFIEFMVDIGNHYRKSELTGVYTSISASGVPYSSGVYIFPAKMDEYEYKDRSEDSGPWEGTLHFMNNARGVFQTMHEFDMDHEREPEFVEYLTKILAHSPWNPERGVITEPFEY